MILHRDAAVVQRKLATGAWWSAALSLRRPARRAEASLGDRRRDLTQ